MNGGRADIIEGVDDAADFSATLKAFQLVDIPLQTQKDYFRYASGPLPSGLQTPHGDSASRQRRLRKRRRLHETAGGGSITGRSLQSSCAGELSQLCSSLFEIDEAALRLWLTVREIRAAGETVRTPLNSDAVSRLLSLVPPQLNHLMLMWKGASGTGKPRRSRKAVVRFRLCLGRRHGQRLSLRR